jgi:hypothetical protein
MNNYNRVLVTFIGVSSVLLASCSESDFEALQAPVSATQAPPTGIADQNSFTLAVETVAVEGADVAGVTNSVTVYAADRHNHPVPDDTVIRFLTNGGAIEQQCVIADGSCSVTWNSQDPRPDSGYATIIAYTEGEESFLDLNDNDAYDAGEDFTDLSEPFIDEINPRDNIFDAGLEEFVDRDADNEFDSADGLYTGESCVGDNTVCNRTRLFVWDEITIVMSTSWASVAFNPASPSISVDNSIPIDIAVLDLYGNQMAVGTEVKLAATDGNIDPAAFTVGNGTLVFSTNYTAPAEAGTDFLKVTVISPETSTETVVSLPITINP